MNKKAQLEIFRIIIVLVMGVLFWALWGGSHLAEWASRTVIQNDLQGIEKFLLVNINLWVGFGLFISCIWLLNFRGEG